MKTKLCLAPVILLLLMLSSAIAAMRDVNVIGEMALKRGVISAPPIDHDFSTIPAGAKYHPSRLLVRFAEKKGGGQHTSSEKLGILQSIGGLKIKREYKIVPGLACIEIPNGMKLENVLRALNNKEGIIFAEPDYEVTTTTIPNDTYFGGLWGMHNTGQTGGAVDADIDAPETWDIATGNSEIIVAVIDTGVDYTHLDLSANMWKNEVEFNGSPGIDDDGNGYIDDIYGYDFCNYDSIPWDDNGHGTHCSGTIGAIGNNNTGVVGVSWQVRIMALKFLNASGYGFDSDAIECIQYSILMGADVLSNSWGGGPYNQNLKNAIESAGTAGMLFVAAAGNDSSNNDVYPVYPASYNSSNIIAVLATDKYDNIASFSNYGQTRVDIGAPGVNIYSCRPGSFYQYLNGTSMAAPHVSGACALLLSINPSLTYPQVKNIILETRDYKSTLSSRCVSNGRLNVHNAVQDSRVWDISALFYFYNSSGEVIAWFDEWGNLVTSGTLTENNANWPTNFNGFKVCNQSGNKIATIESNTGNVNISGTCFEWQSSLTPSGANFVIKDNNGSIVAYFDNSGNLHLKGKVYESI